MSIKEISFKIKENMMKLSNEKDRYLPDVYRVSEMVYCPAKAYYFRVIGISPTLNGKMFSGLLYHDKIKQWIKGIKELEDGVMETECSLQEDDITIKGHTDILTKDTVYEFKYSGSNIEKYGFPDHWIKQANAYACLNGVKQFVVVAVNSNTLEMNIYEGATDIDGFEEMLKDAKMIKKALETKEIPAGPKYKWECRFCDISQVCKNYLTKKVKKK